MRIVSYRTGSARTPWIAGIERDGHVITASATYNFGNQPPTVRALLEAGPAAVEAALANAKRRGLARHVGVSNFTPKLLAEAVALSEEPVVTNQCEYHPRLDQSRVLEACRKNGVSFTSYCPLGRAGDIFAEPQVEAIAKQHGKTPAQVLLRWQVQQPGVIAIPKSANRQRIAENIAIFDFALDEAQMRTLFALASPRGRIVSPAWAPDWQA